MREYGVAIPEPVDQALRSHLNRADGQEDLAFALWTASEGTRRLTALVHTPVLPGAGDREVRGNASFNRQYFERVCQVAVENGTGIAFLHSHPFPGWQWMSEDDVRAELRLAGAASALTNLPLVGLTVGSDGIWSARAWEHREGRNYDRKSCGAVRMLGPNLKAHFADLVLPPPAYREMFQRTVNVWGERAHADLARLRIGIVGLGSVGATVAECLARMGFTRFVLIDFDVVKTHNLDRMVTATAADVGHLKTDVAGRRVRAVATAAAVELESVPFSVAEESGYRAALDCDVLFSCVDRPRARHILNHLAYAHLIPVIDGGIAVWFRQGRFTGADWQVQTVAPGRPCLECLGTYDPGDVSTEEAGLLDDPSYLRGLPADHQLKRNENVFPFAANLATLEVFHLIALTTGAAVDSFGVQRFRYNPGVLELLESRPCHPPCDIHTLVASGDSRFCLIGRDRTAESTRAA